MILYVNNNETRLELWGNVKLITDDVVSDLFEIEIKPEDFELRGLRFKYLNVRGGDTDVIDFKVSSL